MTTEDRELVVRLFGSLDAGTKDRFDRGIIPLLDGHPLVTLDLSGLASLEPHGLLCLLRLRDERAAAGRRLRLRGGGHVLRQWDRMDELFEIAE